MESAEIDLEIPRELAGKRLDQALAELLPGHSRSQIQRWIRDGLVSMGETRWRPRDKVSGGEQVMISVPASPEVRLAAEAIPLDIIFEDEALLVIDKPAGLVVHPGAGNAGGTLLNALLNHEPTLAELPRAGIVHRLDKATTGLLAIAKTDAVRLSLIAQLQQRSVAREYLAVVQGVMVAGGTVDIPIGRHHKDRLRMAATTSGKPAVTHYRVKEKYAAHTLLRVNLETGRTHQIRVHMAHIHHPLVGDPVYGGRFMLPPGSSEILRETLQGFKRQALHAHKLGLLHPVTREELSWRSEMPEDFRLLCDALRG
ncbi:MAG: 23S rRNA pseudouridine(1911/1915/1917) synthase RluD [Gammaproteobacteria bacterium]|nr:MAG: 23S rRNA pseudouridine(1911/1915/1917) synthase RluD [Gammaproteobacteria bacterium]